jgi:hypothetical protein
MEIFCLRYYKTMTIFLPYLPIIVLTAQLKARNVKFRPKDGTKLILIFIFLSLRS